VLPCIVFFIVFRYPAIAGNLIAFKDVRSTRASGKPFARTVRHFCTFQVPYSGSCFPTPWSSAWSKWCSNFCYRLALSSARPYRSASKKVQTITPTCHTFVLGDRLRLCYGPVFPDNGLVNLLLKREFALPFRPDRTQDFFYGRSALLRWKGTGLGASFTWPPSPASIPTKYEAATMTGANRIAKPLARDGFRHPRHNIVLLILNTATSGRGL
jgi:ABC-type polysaccharide transport system permease subunit